MGQHGASEKENCQMFSRKQKGEESLSSSVFYQRILVCLDSGKWRVSGAMVSPLESNWDGLSPATLCLLRAAGSVSVFLELLQDKGGRQTSWGKKLQRNCLIWGKMHSVSRDISSDSSLWKSDCPIQMSRVAVSVKLKLSHTNKWVKFSQWPVKQSNWDGLRVALLWDKKNNLESTSVLKELY